MGVPLILDEVPDTTPYVQYISGSGQTVFPYPFPITQDSDLIVVVNGVTLATDAGYTLSGQGNDTGGNVTFTSGQTAGTIVTLFRDIPIERLTQIAQNSGFASSTFNAEFNNIYLIMQQIEAQFAQCLQVPNTNSPAPTTVLTPNLYANKYLSFDSNGNPTPAILTTSGSVTQALIAALLNPATAAEVAAGVTPSAYQYLYHGPVYNVLRYGAAGDGVTNDSPAIQSAVNVAQIFGGTVYFPPGYKWGMSTQVTISSKYPVNLIGEMTMNANQTANASYIKPLGNITGSLFKYVSPTGTISEGGAGLIRGLSFMDDSNLAAGTAISRRQYTMTAALNLDSFAAGTVENCAFTYLKGSAILQGYVIQTNFDDLKIHYCGDTSKAAILHQSSGSYQSQGCTYTRLISEVNFTAPHVQFASNTQDCRIIGFGFETTETSDETSPYIQFNGLRNSANTGTFNRRPSTGYAVDFTNAGRCTVENAFFDLQAGLAINFANDRNTVKGGFIVAATSTTAPISWTGTRCKLIGVNLYTCPGFTIAGNFATVADCTFDAITGSSGYCVAASASNFKLEGNEVISPSAGVGGFNLNSDGVCTGNTLSGSSSATGIIVNSANVICEDNEIANFTTNLNPTSHTADSIISNNIGYVNKAIGATASVADGGTITHGLAATPNKVICTGTVAGTSVNVTATGSTTFTVAVKAAGGGAGTTQTIYWEAAI